MSKKNELAINTPLHELHKEQRKLDSLIMNGGLVQQADNPELLKKHQDELDAKQKEFDEALTEKDKAIADLEAQLKAKDEEIAKLSKPAK